MNLSTIRTEVRDIIGETTADFWSDAELNRHINEAQRRFAGANRWSFLLTEGTGELAASDPELLLVEGVAEYRHLHMMLTKDGDTAPYIPARVTPTRGFQLRTIYYTDQSYPQWWYVVSAEDSDQDAGFQTTVRFVPAPVSSMDVEYQYYRVPSTLDGDSDVPEIPLDYHKALVHYAAATAWLKERDGESKASTQFDLYGAVLSEAFSDEEAQADDDILVVGGDGPRIGARFSPRNLKDYALSRIPTTLGP